MRFRIALVLAVCMLMGADAPQKNVTNDIDALNGVWHLESGQADGLPMAEAQLAGGKLVLDGADYTVTLPGMGTVTGRQKLDPSLDPKTIDITDATGPNQGKTCLGIYECEGDEFRVVFALPGHDRPKEFKTTPGTGEWLHVWKRVQK